MNEERIRAELFGRVVAHLKDNPGVGYLAALRAVPTTDTELVVCYRLAVLRSASPFYRDVNRRTSARLEPHYTRPTT